MARPALIIGLGGTGQWVLTFLKKELIESNNGVMPQEIKLLAFDTLKHPSVCKDTYAAEKCHKRAGAVELADQIEYFHIGADLLPLLKQIEAGNLPHLEWVKSYSTVARLPITSLLCNDGVGAIRYLGRLCLFNDAQNRAVSKIIATISSALREINQQHPYINCHDRLEIIIVGSLAGGTGSATLADMALLCRKLAENAFGGNIIISGFIVSPRAFTQGGGTHADSILANSFAAWRELDRLMITHSKYGSNCIQYGASNSSLTLKIERRLFDVTYIIDPMHPETPVQPGQPEKNLFPALANIISVKLDDIAGVSYLYPVLSTYHTIFNNPRTALHSAVGSYTMKVPVYYEQMKFTYQLATEALKSLLAPVENEGKVTSLRDDRNQEVDAAKVGLNSALDFLMADSILHNGTVLPNTLLGKRISDIRKNNHRDDEIYKRRAAGSNLPDERNAMVNVQQDVSGATIQQGFNKEYGYHIWQDVAHSMDIGKDPNTTDEHNRIQNGITDSRTNHLGAPGAIGGSRGRLGEELEKAKWAQVRLFGAYLAAFTEQTLNGNSPNPEVARGGKLGYMLAFYKNLVETLEYYIDFLEDVSKVRAEELHKEANARKRAAHAWNNFLKNPRKHTWLTFWDQNIHPRSYNLLREYLKAEDYLNDVLKENILLAYASQTAEEWIKIAKTGYEDLKRWEICLAKGSIVQMLDPIDRTSFHTSAVLGLYKTIEQELIDTEINHKLDHEVGGAIEVIKGTEYEFSSQDIQMLLSKLHWHVTPIYQETHLSDDSTFQNVVGMDSSFVAMNGQQTMEFLKDGETARDNNLNIMQQLAGESFAIKVQEDPPLRAAEAIFQNPDTDTSAKLAWHLHNKAEPFYLKANLGIGPINSPHPRKAYIGLDFNYDAETTQFFTNPEDGFKAKLADLDRTVFLEDFVPSKDAFKMTYVRFDDCIASQDFDIWQRCRDAYLRLACDPRKGRELEYLHVFPAEIHACQYERKIMNELHQPYRILDPMVVALLEDQTRIEMFFHALALQWIVRREAPLSANGYWVYCQPGGSEIQLTVPLAEVGKQNEEDYFVLINQFCNNATDFRQDHREDPAYQVDWKVLQSELYDRVRQLTESDRDKIYGSQIHDPNGFVERVRELAKKHRNNKANPLVDERAAAPYESLADLAETIYRIAIQAWRKRSIE